MNKQKAAETLKRFNDPSPEGKCYTRKELMAAVTKSK